MDDRQRDDMRVRIRAFRLAAEDMGLVVQAGKAILCGEYAVLRRLLDTALVVTYARPFSKSEGRAQLGERFAPSEADDRRLHNAILELRRTLYAHNDDVPARKYMYLGHGLHAAAWGDLREEVIAHVVAIATTQGDRFVQESLRLEGLMAPDGGVRFSAHLSSVLERHTEEGPPGPLPC